MGHIRNMRNSIANTRNRTRTYKAQHKEYAERIFAGSNIKITTQGTRHLAAVLDDISFKEVSKLSTVMEKSIRNLSKIDICSDSTQKFTFLLRTVPDTASYLLPIEETLR